MTGDEKYCVQHVSSRCFEKQIIMKDALIGECHDWLDFVALNSENSMRDGSLLCITSADNSVHVYRVTQQYYESDGGTNG